MSCVLPVRTIVTAMLCWVSAILPLSGCDSKEDRCARIRERWDGIESTSGTCRSHADCRQYPRIDPGGTMGQPKHAGFSDRKHAAVLKRLAEEWTSQQCGPVITNVDSPSGKLSPCCHEHRCSGCSPPSGRGY